MSGKKISCLGGGSIYFAGVMGDIAVTKGLEGSEIVLYDLDNEKSERVMKLGRRLFEESGADYRIRVAEKLEDALEGADFTLSSIGGTGTGSKGVYGSYYHGSDMYIPSKYGVHQVIGDTCGPAGMMMGLRTVPVYLKIAREMEKYCPNTIFINHSNPMAVLCKAMLKHSSIKTIGLCHGVQCGVHSAAELLEVPYKELECVWIGTNHYYWFTRVSHKGVDVTGKLLNLVKESGNTIGSKLSARLSEIYGHSIVYRDDSHIFEFYPYATQLFKTDMEDGYGFAESALVHEFDVKNPTIPQKTSMTQKDTIEYYADFQKTLDEVSLSQFKIGEATESLGELLSSIANGKRKVCIVNVPNNGSIPNLPSDALVEVEAVTDSQGVRNLYMDKAPLHLKGILEKRFVWHELVADAAAKGDRNLALQALLLDEMAILPDKAEKMLEELLLASRDLLPQFSF